MLYWPDMGQSFKRKSHKTVKHTQTIRRQQPTNCLSVFVHFWGLELKGLINLRHFAMPYKRYSKCYMVQQISIIKISFIIAYHSINIDFLFICFSLRKWFMVDLFKWWLKQCRSACLSFAIFNPFMTEVDII